MISRISIALPKAVKSINPQDFKFNKGVATLAGDAFNGTVNVATQKGRFALDFANGKLAESKGIIGDTVKITKRYSDDGYEKIVRKTVEEKIGDGFQVTGYGSTVKTPYKISSDFNELHKHTSHKIDSVNRGDYWEVTKTLQTPTHVKTTTTIDRKI